MLVLGDNKQSTIDRHPILRWYQDQFSAYLSRSDARLMVIGYSFSDRHINRLILDAWRKHRRLAMFIIHPRGWTVLDRKSWMLTSAPNPLEEVTNAGASTRPLTSTFAGDIAEHRKIMRFFDS
jgi:hypothetical protein